MKNAVALYSNSDGSEVQLQAPSLPHLIQTAEPQTRTRVLEFFIAQLPNANTRKAYGRAVFSLLNWCEDIAGVSTLNNIQPSHVALWVSDQRQRLAPATVKQHLAAVRVLFDWLVVGQVLPLNPAASVKGPKHSSDKGKTPILSDAEFSRLYDAITGDRIAAKRDRALIALLAYSGARIGAALKMKVRDFYKTGETWCVFLHEKGGKERIIPAHHKLIMALSAYITAAGLSSEPNSPLFRALERGPGGGITPRKLYPDNALAMIKRRAKAAGVETRICLHSLRAGFATNYMRNGGDIQLLQKLLGHADIKTTMVYARNENSDEHREIERVGY